jgi:hypothetical protein
VTASSSDEPLAYAPLVLLQQHGAEVGQRIRAGIIERPDDTARVYWLERFTDDDLCELATIIFNRPGSLRRIRAERERLLGAMVAA